MDEKTMNKFYELYMDMLQDMRADAKTEERYYVLIDSIFNNLRLNYSDTELTIKSDECLMNILKTLEPERYKRLYDGLIRIKENEEEE